MGVLATLYISEATEKSCKKWVQYPNYKGLLEQKPPILYLFRIFYFQETSDYRASYTTI